ncbi:MAG: HpaII family restriction endonuclease [Aureispira sp.]
MKQKFTFIDLFAGIGGFHIAMHELGGECVFASEMDQHARITYEHNFNKISPTLFSNECFNDDIRKVNPEDIPDFDILCAGFPCQPFSQAGQKRGFDDNHNSERGNLFFNIAEIIEAKRPKAFFLENVRGLVKHDNGNTFQVIQTILEKELKYSFYYKIVKASDYGLPQLRPRVFMIGFRDEDFMKGFQFPPKRPLKYTMSDVWEGVCSREIGFTLRVGGRGSAITDRRNWDSYYVDGQVKRLEIKQGKRMQGFPEDYEFPVSNTQGIKQLGNSVAVDAIKAVGAQMLRYLDILNAKESLQMKKKNKGEWTKLLVFVKLLAAQQLHLSDTDLNPKQDSFQLHKVTTRNLNLEFLLLDKNTIQAVNKETGHQKNIDISELLNANVLKELTKSIINSKGTFSIPEFKVIQDALGFEVVKGGTSQQKADIVLDIENEYIRKENEGFGIKSYLGAKPTLLNASGNTNFIFRIDGLDKQYLDEINAIKTRTKLKDRLQRIEELGGKLVYVGAERATMEYNLALSDSAMPKIIGQVLLEFYKNRTSQLSDIIDSIHKKQTLQEEITYKDKNFLEVKIKRLLVYILLGFFAGKEWDGKNLANGTIVMKKTGDCVGFHVIQIEDLKEYLYKEIKLDTPSTTRHRFGQVYLEKDKKLYLKLNLQLRFR